MLTIRRSRNDKTQITQLILGKLQLVLMPSIRVRPLKRSRTRPDGRADRRRVRSVFRQDVAQQVGQELGDRVGERFDPVEPGVVSTRRRTGQDRLILTVR